MSCHSHSAKADTHFANIQRNKIQQKKIFEGSQQFQWQVNSDIADDSFQLERRFKMNWQRRWQRSNEGWPQSHIASITLLALSRPLPLHTDNAPVCGTAALGCTRMLSTLLTSSWRTELILRCWVNCRIHEHWHLKRISLHPQQSSVLTSSMLDMFYFLPLFSWSYINVDCIITWHLDTLCAASPCSDAGGKAES